MKALYSRLKQRAAIHRKIALGRCAGGVRSADPLSELLEEAAAAIKALTERCEGAEDALQMVRELSETRARHNAKLWEERNAAVEGGWAAIKTLYSNRERRENDRLRSKVQELERRLNAVAPMQPYTLTTCVDPVPAKQSPLPCGCHCAGGCSGNPLNPCTRTCDEHVPF